MINVQILFIFFEKLTHICACVAIIYSCRLKYTGHSLPLTADIMSCNGHIWDCSSGCPGIADYCYPVSRVEGLLHGKLCLLVKIWNRFKHDKALGWNDISWLQTVDHVVEASVFHHAVWSHVLRSEVGYTLGDFLSSLWAGHKLSILVESALVWWDDLSSVSTLAYRLCYTLSCYDRQLTAPPCG